MSNENSIWQLVNPVPQGAHGSFRSQCGRWVILASPGKMGESDCSCPEPSLSPATNRSERAASTMAVLMSASGGCRMQWPGVPARLRHGKINPVRSRSLMSEQVPTLRREEGCENPAVSHDLGEPGLTSMTFPMTLPPITRTQSPGLTAIFSLIEQLWSESPDLEMGNLPIP